MSNKPTLLIVDDDPLIVETLSMLLGPDFDITSAPSRQRAIDAVRALPAPPALALVEALRSMWFHDYGVVVGVVEFDLGVVGGFWSQRLDQTLEL